MNHNLQIVGTLPDLHARCSCGQWEKRDESWEWEDGIHIRAESWDDFESHARGENPSLTKCFHVVGWHPNIPRKEHRSSNLSDGAIFSSMELAKQYVLTRDMTVLSVNPILLESGDERIDYFVKPDEIAPC